MIKQKFTKVCMVYLKCVSCWIRSFSWMYLFNFLICQTVFNSVLKSNRRGIREDCNMLFSLVSAEDNHVNSVLVLPVGLLPVDAMSQPVAEIASIPKFVFRTRLVLTKNHHWKCCCVTKIFSIHRIDIFPLFVVVGRRASEQKLQVSFLFPK